VPSESPTSGSDEEGHSSSTSSGTEYASDVVPSLSLSSDHNPAAPPRRYLPWHDRKLFGFFGVGCVTLLYVVAELGAGMALHSLVLFADGMHNASDLFALGVAYAAQVAASKGDTCHYTFGLGRAEMLGAGANGMFLLSLSIFVVLESVPKFYAAEAPPSDAGWILVISALGGIVVNTFAMVVFCMLGDGGLGHGGHGHGHGSSHHETIALPLRTPRTPREKDLLAEEVGFEKLDEAITKSRDMNMYAAFLHQLGDMASSGIVLVVGIIVLLVDTEGATWSWYVDPVASLLIVGLILYTTLPLVRQVSKTLLLPVPSGVSVQAIRAELLELPGVVEVHDLRIFESSDVKVGSAHARVNADTIEALSSVGRLVSQTLRRRGVNHTTVQLEIESDADECHGHVSFQRR
jgi:solute carrier family 30 (zinc transporter), member 1